MLYVHHGSDIPKGVQKSRDLINSLRTKRPDAAFVSVSADNWHDSIIEEHIGGQGLFSNKYIIFLNRVMENTLAEEILLDFIPSMKESDNIFIVLEGKLKVEAKRVFEKHADKIVSFEEKEKSKKKEEFNIFTLADALGSKDSFKAWSVYRQAIDSGMAVESIAGTIFWQMKSIFLASKTKSVSESGLNSFVYGKAKSFAGNYSDEELKRWLERLIKIYHEGHRGRGDMELGIERLLFVQ